MIAIIDYGGGNLGSVVNALSFLGAECAVTRDASVLRSAEGVILPGVGAFGDAVRSLRANGLTEPVRACALSDKPFLGICLGLQMLFGSSEESPDEPGLGILPGRVLKMPNQIDADLFEEKTSVPAAFKVPHMGWNCLEMPAAGERSALFAGLEDEPYVYFVHSYYVRADERGDVIAETRYTALMDTAVGRGRLFGVQFHPEKSGAAGLKILRNFVEMTK